MGSAYATTAVTGVSTAALTAAAAAIRLMRFMVPLQFRSYRRGARSAPMVTRVFNQPPAQDPLPGRTPVTHPAESDTPRPGHEDWFRPDLSLHGHRNRRRVDLLVGFDPDPSTGAVDDVPLAVLDVEYAAVSPARRLAAIAVEAAVDRVVLVKFIPGG